MASTVLAEALDVFGRFLHHYLAVALHLLAILVDDLGVRRQHAPIG